MNSGQPPSTPRKIQVNPSSWKLIPTLQLKIEANSSTENWGQLLEWIQTNPSPQESLGEPFSWILKPTLQLKIQTNSSTEN